MLMNQIGRERLSLLLGIKSMVCKEHKDLAYESAISSEQPLCIIKMVKGILKAAIKEFRSLSSLRRNPIFDNLKEF